MATARRQEILHTLGVDLYERRPVQASADAPAEPAVAVATTAEAVRQRSAQAEVAAGESPVAVDTVAESRASYGDSSLTLTWWQFEDLLLLEEISGPGASDPAAHHLAVAIAAALGRSSGPKGELRWPPGGDFSLISLGEFLQHFVQGRAEGQDNLQLILTSERLLDHFATVEARRIPTLAAMLAEPALKAEAWKLLKLLRR